MDNGADNGDKYDETDNEYLSIPLDPELILLCMLHLLHLLRRFLPRYVIFPRKRRLVWPRSYVNIQHANVFLSPVESGKTQPD